jgi:histidinol-phosphate/aromatic aminotransferase/cobyric acid decarboxylase-like protein
VIESFKTSTPIWNINSVAEYFIELLFKNRPQLEASFAQSKKDRSDFARMVSDVEGVKEVIAGGGHFILAIMDPDVFPSPEVVDDLLVKYSIYVKDVTSVMGGKDTCLRFAVRDTNDHRQLVAALSGLAKERSCCR